MCVVNKTVAVNDKNNKNRLKPLFSKHLKMKNLIGFDIETHGENNEFYMAGLFFQDGTYKSFYSQEELIKEFLNKEYYNNTYIVATNLAFDYAGSFFNTKMWNKGETILANGRLLSVTFTNSNKRRLTLIDSMNHAPFSVAKMGEILNIPKLPKPNALGKIPKNRWEREELETYNKRDCEVTLRFMELLTKGYYEAGGKLKITIASTALDIFRRKYLRQTIYKEDSQLGYSVKKQIFQSYYGGRTEVFTRGSVYNVKQYDINSLYPSVMLNEYPNPKTVVHKQQGSIDIIERYEGITFVKLFCPDMKYPLLPYRVDGKLLFPTGNIEGFYTHVELRKAFSLGYHLRELGETIYYKKTFYPFKEYVLDLYAKRLEYKSIKHPNEIVYKLCLNSLYGKFATKNFHDTTFFNKEYLTDDEIDKVRSNPDVFMKDDNNGMIIKKLECEESYVIPILSSYTTSYARLKIYDYIVEHNALYCDTDCVITYDDIFETKELGGMKLEHDSIIEKAILVKPKMYYLKLSNGKEVLKLKGVPRMVMVNGEEKVISIQEFISILNNNPINYVKFTKLKEGVRRNLIPNSKQYITKDLKLDDNKRCWLERFDKETFEESTPLCIT